MVIDFNAVQSSNASSPILIRELPRLTEVKSLQPQKAMLPIVVTELGMVTEVMPEYSNALSAIEVTPSGIEVPLQPKSRVLVAVSIMALQLERESYTGLSDATFMVVRAILCSNNTLPIFSTPLPMFTEAKEEQLMNAPSPNSFTELGMVMEVKASQPLNAKRLIASTPLPMLTDFKPLQLENALLLIVMTELGMVIAVNPVHSSNAYAPN